MTEEVEKELNYSQKRKLKFRTVTHHTRPGMAQPHNRQRKRAEKRARKARYEREKRESIPKLVMPKEASFKMPTYLIHEILRKNHISRHRLNSKLPRLSAYKIVMNRKAKRVKARRVARRSRIINRAA